MEGTQHPERAPGTMGQHRQHLPCPGLLLTWSICFPRSPAHCLAYSSAWQSHTFLFFNCFVLVFFFLS